MNRFLVAIPLLCLLGVAACDDAAAPASSSEDPITARTDARRARLQRLARIDALARLYVGHELARRELLALGGKNEATVISDLAARPDFRTRCSERVGEFLAADGRGATNKAVDPDAPVAAAFEDKADAERFARWLVRTVAPLAAEEVIAGTGKAIDQLTYREILDAARAASETAGGGQ
jgi:hypothetical protein